MPSNGSPRHAFTTSRNKAPARRPPLVLRLLHRCASGVCGAGPRPEGRFLTVAVPGSALEFILWPHAAAAGQPAGTQPGSAPGPVFIESDDLRADFKVLRDRGVTFDRPEPEDYAFGIRIEAVDPDGNRISLRQRSRAGRGTD